MNASAMVSLEDTVEPFFLPGINSQFIMCMGIIRNKSLVGRRTRAEARTLTTERVRLYYIWCPSALTTGPHGQVY